MTNRTYDILKYLAAIGLPAIIALVATVWPLWDLPKADAVVGTLAAINVALGSLVAYKSVTYNQLDKGDKG